MWEWLIVFQRELLLFSGTFFLVGALDELAIDLTWIWGRLTGRVRTHRLSRASENQAPLSGQVAVFVAAWQEAEVIGDTLRHMLEVWPHKELRIYLGCYRNDPETLAAATAQTGLNHRLRIVVQNVDGPTTKGHCLNRLYHALHDDERRGIFCPEFVLIHDAEDMVDPAELNVMDEALQTADFVQLPVIALPQRDSRFIAGHYIDEFLEAHSKAMVVRDVLGASIPAAGVGCAVRYSMLKAVAQARETDTAIGRGPFAAGSLTEDYELGLHVNEMGGSSRFIRKRAHDGRLVATRAYFPSRLGCSVRQKTRWMQGIAFDGWDRLGWGHSPAEIWMRMRDRRGPISALLLVAAYVMVVLSALTLVLLAFGAPAPVIGTGMWVLMSINLAALFWRAALRFLFTAREFGMGEGALAVLRIPVSNIIAMMAGRRAVLDYARALAGAPVVWDKTEHSRHPAKRGAQQL